jgi:hypothetical protein
MLTLLSYIAAAFAIWGVGGVPVTVEPSTPGAPGSAQAAVGSIGETCHIYVADGWQNWAPDAAVDIFVHEAGHCWGLWHSRDQHSVMWPEYVVGSGWRPTDTDWDALRAARPPMAFRVLVPSLVALGQ